MSALNDEARALLSSARERGARTVGTTIIPPGLDQFTVYVGLISSALELGKLIQTEERDLKVIGAHHEIEMATIAAAAGEVEAEMMAAFQSDHSLREKTFESINMLIAAGQFEIASEFHKRLMDGFKRGSLDTLIERRNSAAKSSGMQLKVK